MSILQKVLAKFQDGQHAIPKSVAEAARKGLELREKYGRGGTSVGLRRARQLSTEKFVSSHDIKQIYSYFSRHEVDKEGEDWDKPSNGKIAWFLWGSEPGKAWATKERKKLDKD